MRSEALGVGGGGASSSAAYASQYRGTGGKIRRPSSRKTPSTPYDRPLSQQRLPAAAVSGGWMSKIVNPAYRLLSGGAARFLPSVFSSSSTPTDAADEEEEDGKYTEAEQETRNENLESSIDLCVSKSTVDEGPSEQEVRPDISNSTEVGRGRSQHLAGGTDGADLSHIEQLIKGKTFCREDIERLMGIMQARVFDAEGGHISNVSTTGKDDKVEIPLRNRKSTNEEKEEDIDEDMLATLTPLLQPMVKEEIGASPVELAKAYMGSRASEFDFGSKSLAPKNDRLLLSHTIELPSNRFLTPPSPQPSICWPGAIVQEQHGFSTPCSQKGRYGTSNHSRTPYSRIYSRSKSKLAPLEGTDRKISDISASPFQKQTPFYGESRIRATEDVQGSVGPIRRLRSKFISETPRRGSPSLWSSQKGSPQVKESFLGDNPLATKSFEPTSINTSFQSPEQKGLSEADTSVVHPQTSKLARQILEQISRTPTRKEKSEELKLVIGKKKSLTSEVSGTDAATTSYVGGFLPDKGRESPFYKVPSANIRTGGINGTNRDSTSASKTPQKSSISFGNITPSTTNQDSTQANEMPHPKKGPIAANNLPSAGAHALKAPKAPTTSGTKPVLPPIFVDKSNHRVRFALDNSTSGFTFPVTAPSSSSEPPTPSMMPFSLATDVNPPRDDAKPPTYTFGEKKSAAPLVFSFPSTSNASTLNDTPVFKFGSDGGRVSFSSIGKDAVCC